MLTYKELLDYWIKQCDVENAWELLEFAEDNEGVCRACLEFQGPVDPDAFHARCVRCGEKEVVSLYVLVGV